MRLQNPFAAINTTGIDSQVLVVLARSEQFLTVKQIHGLLPEGGSLEGVRKSVGRLVEQGTVTDRVVGKSAAYALNREHLLAEPILQIAGAKQQLLSRLAVALKEWEIPPLTAKLFGSAVRSDMLESSDIDLFLVMPDELGMERAASLVGELAAKAALWTGNDVRPLLYLAREIEPASIFDSILAEGVDIAGDPSWLRKRLQELGRAR